MIRRFTGWHMAVILVSFFGVVVAVNFLMAHYAISTFGGTVAENGYVASRNYNRWLADADRQAKLGWSASVGLDETRHVVVSLTKAEVPLADVKATGVATHTLGRAPAITLTFPPSSDGRWQSREALPEGRWVVALTLRHESTTFKRREIVQ